MELNTHVTEAFRLAHRARQDARLGKRSRALFAAIATELWKAHGEIALDADKCAAAPASAAEVE